MTKEVGNMDDITIYVRKEARTIGVGHLRQKAGEVQTLLVILKISLRDLPTSSSEKTDWLIGFYVLDLV